MQRPTVDEAYHEGQEKRDSWDAAHTWAHYSGHSAKQTPQQMNRFDWLIVFAVKIQ